MNHFLRLAFAALSDPNSPIAQVCGIGWLILRVEMLHRSDRAQNTRLHDLEAHTGLAAKRRAQMATTR